jgi:hypothetical protein
LRPRVGLDHSSHSNYLLLPIPSEGHLFASGLNGLSAMVPSS